MNYNRKFIKNYFVNAISLTNLTKKKYVMNIRIYRRKIILES